MYFPFIIIYLICFWLDCCCCYSLCYYCCGFAVMYVADVAVAVAVVNVDVDVADVCL